MSFAIRPLIKRTSGKCELCQSQVELVYLDSDLGRPRLLRIASRFWQPQRLLWWLQTSGIRTTR